MHLRLNLAGAERQDELHEAIVVEGGQSTIRFDLSGIDLETFDLRSAWTDLIFARPAMSEIWISEIDLRVERAPR